MRVILLASIALISVLACKKSKDNTDKNCGTIITKERRPDGGVEEKVVFSGCGDLLQQAKKQWNITDAGMDGFPTAIYYKGYSRPGKLYMLVMSTGKVVEMVRYDDKVPDATVAYYKSIGLEVLIVQRNGLEAANY